MRSEREFEREFERSGERSGEQREKFVCLGAGWLKERRSG